MQAHRHAGFLAEGGRRDLAQVVTLLLAAWGLPPEMQVELLGMRRACVPRLADYRAGEPLPAVGQSVERAAELVAIHRALGLAFPGDPDLRYGWIHRPNPLFGRAPIHRTPLAVMLSGLDGIRKVEWIVEGLVTYL